MCVFLKKIVTLSVIFSTSQAKRNRSNFLVASHAGQCAKTCGHLAPPHGEKYYCRPLTLRAGKSSVCAPSAGHSIAMRHKWKPFHSIFFPPFFCFSYDQLELQEYISLPGSLRLSSNIFMTRFEASQTNK